MQKEYLMSAALPFPSYLAQKCQLTQWKKENNALKAVHSQVTQNVVKQLHNTWEVFKKRKYRFPRYKKYGNYLSHGHI